MKKMIAMLMATVLLLGATAFLLVGCGGGGSTPGGTVVGKTGAKLLLANERLGVSFIDMEDGIFGGAEDALQGMAAQGRSFASTEGLTALSATTLSESPMITDIVSASRNYTAFNETVDQSVTLAERGADMIRMMKEHVRVLDTWVTWGETKMLLHVEQNSELLLCVDNTLSYACYRTRLENGKEKYDLIQVHHNDALAIRASYMKNELYECSHMAGNAGDYLGFSAQKVGDDWECLSYSYHPENAQPFGFEYVILSADLCFKAIKEPIDGEIRQIVLSSKDRSEDVLSLTEFETESVYSIYLGAFSGYQGVLKNGSTEYDCNVVLADGSLLSSANRVGEGEVGVQYTVIFESAWGTECEVAFSITGGTPDQRNAIFAAYLDGIGIRRGETMTALLSDINRARAEVAAVNNGYKWNGYEISNAAGCNSAINAEKARFQFFSDAFDAYRDYPEIDANDVSATQLASFAELVDATATVSVAEDKTVTVTDAGACVTDLTLFERGENYHLAFALMGGGGLIHLSGYDKVETVLEGDRLELATEHTTFSVAGIAAGEYVIVMYASTADGIRSSKPSVIGSVIIEAPLEAE